MAARLVDLNIGPYKKPCKRCF